MCHCLMWICECGKIQKNMGFICTCRILVCNHVKSLKYRVFKCFNKKLISLDNIRIIPLSGVHKESTRTPQGLTQSPRRPVWECKLHIHSVLFHNVNITVMSVDD